MKRRLLIRLVLLVVGVLVWAYGFRTDSAEVRLAAIAIMAVAFLVRFVPGRWLGGDPPP